MTFETGYFSREERITVRLKGVGRSIQETRDNNRAAMDGFFKSEKETSLEVLKNSEDVSSVG